MNVRRLKMLHRALIRYAQAPGNLGFDLAYWAGSSEYNQDLMVSPTKVIAAALRGDNYCGTTACACGLAASLPAFQEEGLSMVPSSLFQGVQLAYGAERGFNAAAAFFDIPIYDAEDLFSSLAYLHHDNNALAVADRIHALLQTEGAERNDDEDLLRFVDLSTMVPLWP